MKRRRSHQRVPEVGIVSSGLRAEKQPIQKITLYIKSRQLRRQMIKLVPSTPKVVTATVWAGV